MEVLHLTLKKKWFDMILSGEKKEEYREIKPYWFARLLYKIQHPKGGYFTPAPDIMKKNYECTGWKEFTGGAPIFESFSAVKFTNGYSKTSPQIILECDSIIIGNGKNEWGAQENTPYFIIKLGNIISTSNITNP